MALSAVEFLLMCRENEALRRENDHLKFQLSQQGDDGYIINTNGKRQVTSAHE